MTVVEEEFAAAEPETWNDSAEKAINQIYSIIETTGAGSLGAMREHFDNFLNANNSYPLDEEFCYLSWRTLGALALLTARANGVFTEDAVEPEDFSSILVSKQTDYGSDAINRFGRIGLMVRVHDKIARLENLTRRGIDPGNESLFDNYMDVVNYCALGMMVEYEWFMLPLEEKK